MISQRDSTAPLLFKSFKHSLDLCPILGIFGCPFWWNIGSSLGPSSPSPLSLSSLSEPGLWLRWHRSRAGPRNSSDTSQSARASSLDGNRRSVSNSWEQIVMVYWCVSFMCYCIGCLMVWAIMLSWHLILKLCLHEPCFVKQEPMSNIGRENLFWGFVNRPCWCSFSIFFFSNLYLSILHDTDVWPLFYIHVKNAEAWNIAYPWRIT